MNLLADVVDGQIVNRGDKTCPRGTRGLEDLRVRGDIQRSGSAYDHVRRSCVRTCKVWTIPGSKGFNSKPM